MPYFALLVGRRPGIYHDEASLEAEMKDVPLPLFKSFKTTADAVAEYTSFMARDPSNELVIVYTDGACVRNGTKHAAAGVGVFWGNEDPRNVSRPVHGFPTNNVAELEAIEDAIETIVTTRKPHTEYRILSDSQYAIHALTLWFSRWARSNWRTSNGSPVKNVELIQRIHEKLLLLGDMVKLVHVRGHVGIIGNEMADALASRACTYTTVKTRR